MVGSFECFSCRKVVPLSENQEAKCPICGSENGQIIHGERVTLGLKAGIYLNIDPKAGGRAKLRSDNASFNPKARG